MSIEEKQRVNSIDLLRGLIMIIMALDHTRDYFHWATFVFNATNLDKTYPALFATRWITHFCAPAFVFLSGISINIQFRRKSRGELTKFLLTRGLWLVFLDLVVLRFAFFFNFYYDLTFLSILWMLGMCMIFMSIVLYLPYRATLITSLVIIAGHDAIGGLVSNAAPVPDALWKIFLTSGFVPPAFVTTYPILPWLGIMTLGYSIGRLYGDKYDPVLRRRLLVQLGALSLLLFFILRWINIYGDPAPWNSQLVFPMNVISFFNVSKYPVSLLFSLMTLGPLMIFLSLLETAHGAWTKPPLVFGRVPLFYFLLHFFVIHASALLQRMWSTGKSFSEIDLHFSPTSFGGVSPEGGLSLWGVYAAWILIVTAIYPICQWYDKYKSTHKKWWLSYL